MTFLYNDAASKDCGTRRVLYGAMVYCLVLPCFASNWIGVWTPSPGSRDVFLKLTLIPSCTTWWALRSRHESRISMALRMKPSAPTLSIYYRGSKDGAKGLESGVGGGSPGGDDMSSDDDEVQAVLPLSIAPKASSLLTRLSLHGQGIRKIEGFEAFPCLEILVSLLSSCGSVLHTRAVSPRIIIRALRDGLNISPRRVLVEDYKADRPVHFTVAADEGVTAVLTALHGKCSHESSVRSLNSFAGINMVWHSLSQTRVSICTK